MVISNFFIFIFSDNSFCDMFCRKSREKGRKSLEWLCLTTLSPMYRAMTESLSSGPEMKRKSWKTPVSIEILWNLFHYFVHVVEDDIFWHFGATGFMQLLGKQCCIQSDTSIKGKLPRSLARNLFCLGCLLWPSGCAAKVIQSNLKSLLLQVRISRLPIGV